LTSEDFHFSSKFLVYPDDAPKLAPGQAVTFIASGVAEGGRRRSARAVLVVGEPADGRLVSLPVGRPYGWIKVEDDGGDRHLVYAPVTELAGYKIGDALSFIVGGNDRGACAQNVELLDADQAA
jgi:hypothetical protein